MPAAQFFHETNHAACAGRFLKIKEKDKQDERLFPGSP